MGNFTKNISNSKSPNSQSIELKKKFINIINKRIREDDFQIQKILLMKSFGIE